jgi:hypothetical protein
VEEEEEEEVDTIIEEVRSSTMKRRVKTIWNESVWLVN